MVASSTRICAAVAMGAVLMSLLVSHALAEEPVGWTKIPLMDDKEAPGGVIYHEGTDLVSDIWFKDLEHGLVGTLQGQGDDGGVVYTAAGGKLTGVAWRGHNASIGNDDLGVYRIMPHPDGVVLGVNHAQTFVHAGNDLQFVAEHMGGEFGVEVQYWLAPDETGKWWCITGTGVVWTADEMPGKGVEWTCLWFPEGRPPVPNPIPAGMAGDAALGNMTRMLPYKYVWVSPDGQTIAYPMHTKPAVCVCTDGGTTWLEKPLPGAPESAADVGPYGVCFTDKLHGWTYYSEDLYDQSAYVYSTSDGGNTWTAGKLPDKITAAGADVCFRGMSFLPDNQHGWIVGTRGSNKTPLLLRTTDGGQTWVDKSTGRNSMGSVLGTSQKLYCVFALDPDHIWVGGDYGCLAYCDDAQK